MYLPRSRWNESENAAHVFGVRRFGLCLRNELYLTDDTRGIEIAAFCPRETAGAQRFKCIGIARQGGSNLDTDMILTGLHKTGGIKPIGGAIFMPA